MTLEQVREALVRHEADFEAAKNEQAGAKEALADAQQAHYAAASKPPPLSEAERDALGAAEHGLVLARSRVAKAGFALRRAEQAAAESRARVGRLQPHAALLERLDRACATVAEKDADARRLVADFVARLREAVKEVQAAVEEGAAAYQQLPVEVRPDVTHAVYAALVFGGLDSRDSGILRHLGRFQEAVFQAPPSRPLPWKKKGAA